MKSSLANRHRMYQRVLRFVIFSAIALKSLAALADPLLYVSTWDGTITTVNTAGLKSIFVSGLDHPSGLTFDQSGNLYSLAYYSGTVSKISPNGVNISTFATAYGGGLAWGLASGSSGNVYVTAYLGGPPSPPPGVYEFSTNGSQINFFGTEGFAPVGLAMDNAGYLYVATGGNGTVLKIAPDGSESTFASGFSSATGLTFDSLNNLYVADGTKIEKITPQGSVSTYATGLNDSWGLAFDNQSDNLFVAGRSSGTIYEVNAIGHVTTLATGLDNPAMIAIAQIPEPSPVGLGALGTTIFLYRKRGGYYFSGASSRRCKVKFK